MDKNKFSTLGKKEVWLSWISKIFCFAADQLKNASNSSNSITTDIKKELSIKFSYAKFSSTEIKVQAPRKCSLTNVKKFINDGLSLSDCSFYNNNSNDNYWEISFEFFNEYSGTGSIVLIKNGRVEECEHSNSCCENLTISAKVDLQEDESLWLLDGLRSFLKKWYLIYRQHPTLVEYKVSDVQGTGIFKNDTSSGFVSIGKLKLVGNAQAYADSNGLPRFEKGDRLDLTRSKPTRIPNTDFSLTIAYGTFPTHDSTNINATTVTFLPFFDNEMPLQSAELEFFASFLDRLKTLANEHNVRILPMATTSLEFVFDVRTKPHYVYNSQENYANFLVIVSLELTTKTPLKGHFSNADSSWSDDLIKWLLTKITKCNFRAGIKRKVKRQSDAKCIAQNIARSFTEVLANANKKGFRKQCQRLTQTDSVDLFQGKVTNLVEEYLTKRYCLNNKALSNESEFRGKSDFEQLGFTDSCSHEEQKVREQKSLLDTKREMARKRKDRAFDNEIKKARPRMEIASDAFKAFPNGIPLMHLVEDAIELPQKFYPDQKKRNRVEALTATPSVGSSTTTSSGVKPHSIPGECSFVNILYQGIENMSAGVNIPHSDGRVMDNALEARNLSISSTTPCSFTQQETLSSCNTRGSAPSINLTKVVVDNDVTEISNSHQEDVCLLYDKAFGDLVFPSTIDSANKLFEAQEGIETISLNSVLQSGSLSSSGQHDGTGIHFFKAVDPPITDLQDIFDFPPEEDVDFPFSLQEYINS